MTTGVTVDYLADSLGLDAGDILVVLGWLGHGGGQLTPVTCSDVRAVLDDECARTVPELFGLAALDWRTDDEPL